MRQPARQPAQKIAAPRSAKSTSSARGSATDGSTRSVFVRAAAPSQRHPAMASSLRVALHRANLQRSRRPIEMYEPVKADPGADTFILHHSRTRNPYKGTINSSTDTTTMYHHLIAVGYEHRVRMRIEAWKFAGSPVMQRDRSWIHHC